MTNTGAHNDDRAPSGELFSSRRANEDPDRLADERFRGHVDQWPEAAVDYLEGRLDPGKAAALQAHLATCPECRARLERQRLVRQVLCELPLESAPADLEKRVLEAVLAAQQVPASLAARIAPVVTPEKEQPELSWWSRLWRSKVRPWVPATVAVAALLLGILSYGLLRTGAEDQAEFAGARLATTAAPATTSELAKAAGSGEAEKGPSPSEHFQDSASTALASPPAVQAEGVTTTAAAGVATTEAVMAATASSGEARYETATVSDRKGMTAALAKAQQPVYFVFASKEPGQPITGETSEAVVQQLGNITGLEPLAATLALGSPTFAAYLPREDASALVDLLLSVKASLQLDLHLDMQPPEATPEAVSQLLQHKREFPELSAHRTPAPAVSAWSFTTSTLVPPEQAGNSSVATPDEDGSHVLVIILVRK